MGNSNSYTKQEVDQRFENLDFYKSSEIDKKFKSLDFYTKSQIDDKIPSDFYSKSEIDAKIPSDFYTKSQINSGTIWCANGDCITPSGNKKLKWGNHILNMDADKVLRHYNTQGNHLGMGFATENMYATKSLKIGEGKASCLYLGSHEICSDGGSILRIKKSGVNKYFDIYSDPRHSSFRTFNTNDDNSERERWQGYA